MILRIRVPDDFPSKRVAGLVLRDGYNYKRRWVDERRRGIYEYVDTGLDDPLEVGIQESGEDGQS